LHKKSNKRKIKKKIKKKKMSTTTATNLNTISTAYQSSCVREAIRDTITPTEKVVSLILLLFYIPLIISTIKNVLKFYEKERKKYYHFIPRINLLLFTTIYSKCCVLLDGVTILFPKYKDTPLFEDLAVYNFLVIWTFTALSLSCTYISTIW